MATRFYFLNEVAPYTPAAWQGGWDLDGSVTRAFDPHKFGTTSTTATRAETSATAPFRVGVLRLVGRRLAPQTISGTVDMVTGLSESNVAADFYTSLHLYIVNSTLGTVHGTLLNQYTESSAGGAAEWPTTNTGRGLQSAQAISNVTIPNDGNAYRPVAEIGYSSENVDITSRTGSIRYGARPNTVGPALSDLTVGSTSTSTLAGFIEFSGTILLASDVVQHLTPEDAFIIGPVFPYSDSFNVHDSGYTHTIWGVYTGEVGIKVLGTFGFGDLTTYRPRSQVYVGLSDTLSTAFIDNVNRALQIPVDPGVDFYTRYTPNSGNPTPAVLLFNAQHAPDLAVEGGELVVPDDLFLRAAILSLSPDYAVRRFEIFSPGEAGDILPSGVMAMENIVDVTVDIYNADFSLLVKLAINSSTSAGSIRANPTLNKFFAYSRAPNPDQIVSILPSGVIDATYTLLGINNTVRAIAVGNDEITLYYSSSTGDTAAVHRWDLFNSSALPDLVNLGTSTSIWDIHVLLDGTILVLFVNFSLGGIIRHYQTDGTLLHTYDYADNAEEFPFGTPPRIARANDDPASFWYWRHPTSPLGISKFLNIRISDGAVLRTHLSVEYELGAYTPAETATPISRFGNSFSCPFWVLPGGEPPPDEGAEACPIPAIGPVTGQNACPSPNPAVV